MRRANEVLPRPGSDIVVRIASIITYDGTARPAFIGSGVGWNFHLDTMPPTQFLPNIGMTTALAILYGESGFIDIDVIASKGLLSSLRDGAGFTLHDGPSVIIAHGVIVGLPSVNPKTIQTS